MNLKNHFLMAMPGLAGDYFGNTLTYVCEHNDEGAMGIVVNRASDMTLLELFAQVGLSASTKWVDTLVFDGGPVATDRGIVLHSDDKTFTSSAELGEGLYLSTALDVLDAIASDKGPEHFLVALGYAGWGEGQLENEVAENTWLTTPATNDVLFHHDWQQKLNLAAAGMGIDLALIAAQPGHA